MIVSIESGIFMSQGSGSTWYSSWELKKYDQQEAADNKGAEFYPMFQGSC